MPRERLLLQVGPYTHPSKIRGVTDILLLSAAIPNSRYVIHEGNNSYALNGVAQILEVGNCCSWQELLAKLQTDTDFEWRLTDNGFFEIEGNEPFTLSFPNDSTLYRLLGFAPTPTNSNNNILTAPGAPTAFDTQLYRVRLVSPSFQGGAINIGPVLTRRDDAISFHKATSAEALRQQPQFRPPIPSLQSFEVQLLDDVGRPLGLNGLRASIEILVTYV